MSDLISKQDDDRSMSELEKMMNEAIYGIDFYVKKKEMGKQPEDYTELKREFLRMASYIDALLECSDEQKETLMGFISRLAEFMPWTEED